MLKLLGKNASTRFIQPKRFHRLSNTLNSLYEPGYLDIKAEIPSYGTVNVKMQGYDFVILESFNKYVHNLMNHVSLESTCYAVPAKVSKVQIFKPNSTQVVKDFELGLYERIVRIHDLNSTMAPILFELLKTNLPTGVKLNIDHPKPEDDEFRYVPDLALMELQTEVAILDKAREDRKKK